ncbi:MAG: DUF1707 domain-containing protein [Acidimicrobiales bacterium]
MCRSRVPAPDRWRSAPQPAPEPDPTVRVGDHERDQVSAELRAHFTDGRIGVDEFSDRLDATLRSTTAAELAAALHDLPPVPGYIRPWDRSASPAAWGHSTVSRRYSNLQVAAAHAHLRTYLTVMAILIGVWALSGFGYFWPVWPMVFWGFFAFRHAWWARQRQRRGMEYAEWS